MRLIKLTLSILLVFNCFGCSISEYQKEIINGEEFIIYEGIKYPSVLGEPKLSKLQLKLLSKKKAINKITTYIDYLLYIKDKKYENNKEMIYDTFEILENDYDEVGIVYNDFFSLMYIKTNGKYYPVDSKNYNKEWLSNYKIDKYCFDNAEDMCKTLQGNVAFVVYSEVLKTEKEEIEITEVIENEQQTEKKKTKKYNWKAKDDDADSLSTIELTLDDILSEANKERESNCICKYDTEYNKQTAKKDAEAISESIASRIKSADSEFDETYKSINLTIQEAKEDAQIYHDMIQSSYGGYYLYDVNQWENALTESLIKIDELNKDTITGEELADILMECYIFVKDDHYRIAGTSTLDKSGGIYYYYYCKDFDFYKDVRGYFTIKDDNKWYLSSISNDTDIEAYIKPTIAYDGSLAYQVGTFMNIKDNCELILSLKRGKKEILYETEWTKSTSLKDKNIHLDVSQSGVYDGYYVMGIRSFGGKDDEELLKMNNYTNSASYLKDMSNYIIDARSDGGGPGTPYTIKFMEKFTNKSFRFNRSQTMRYSRITKNGDINFMNSYSSKQDGTYYNNKNLFAYLIDKNVGSSGEGRIQSIRQMDNALLIGTNSRGCMTCSFSSYYLPNSKIVVCLGPANMIDGNATLDIEGLGYMPDIYVDGYLALDRTIKMYKYYGLLPNYDANTLNCWGENIPRFE